MPVSPQAFIAGMRQLAAGVTVVTTEDAGCRAGLTATAVCSVSAEPPQLLICVNVAAEAHDVIVSSGRFAVNILSSAQRPIADRFAGVTGHSGEGRFDIGVWRRLVTGAPVLDGCCANFDCRLTTSLRAGSHTIFVGEVQAVQSCADLLPIVYAEGEYGLIAPLGV
ncbi:flavin reductase family protein [Geminicoccaceae bacterium 1502E]|nr:flavin reductase family protein [Geminicoccaceae bacterium 1502E]